MPRQQIPVRPILVTYQCDACGIGQYSPTGEMLMTDPPKFQHKCTTCGDGRIFTEKYPTVRYAEEGALLDLENYTPQTY